MDSQLPSSPPKFTGIRCRECGQVTAAIEHVESDAIVMRCSAYGHRWSWVSAHGCKHPTN
jgi:hypothetical protein